MAEINQVKSPTRKRQNCLLERERRGGTFPDFVCSSSLILMSNSMCPVCNSTSNHCQNVGIHECVESP
jgi:hypothetical protein